MRNARRSIGSFIQAVSIPGVMEKFAGVAILSGIIVVWYELFEVMGVGTFRRRLGLNLEDDPKQLQESFPGGIPPIMRRATRAHQNQLE